MKTTHKARRIQKASGVKRFLAWLMIFAIVAGNMTNVTYAAEGQAGVGSASDEKVLEITEKAIRKMLEKDPEDRKELKPTDMPVKDPIQRETLMQEVQQVIGDRVLVKVVKDSEHSCTYLICVSEGMGFFDGDFIDDDEDFNEQAMVESIDVIAINAGTKEASYRLVIQNETMVTDEIKSTEYRIVNNADTNVNVATSSQAKPATPSDAAKPSTPSQAKPPVGTPSEAEQPEDIIEDTEAETNTETDVTQGTEEGVPSTDVSDSGDALPEQGTQPDQTVSQEQETEAPSKAETSEAEDKTEAEIQEKPAKEETEAKKEKEETEERQEKEDKTEKDEKPEKEVEKSASRTTPMERALSKSPRPIQLVGDSDDEDEIDQEDKNTWVLVQNGEEDRDITQEMKETLYTSATRSISSGKGYAGLIAPMSVEDITFTQAAVRSFWDYVDDWYKELDNTEDNVKRAAFSSIRGVSPWSEGDEPTLIKAGEPFDIDIEYGINQAPPADSIKLGTVSAYKNEDIQEARVEITVPRDLIINGLGEPADTPIENVKNPIDGVEYHTYTIDLSNNTSRSSNKTLTAYFAGNGSAPLNTEYEFTDWTSIHYSGSIILKNPDNPDDAKLMYFDDWGNPPANEEDSADLADSDTFKWRLGTDDLWTVKKDFTGLQPVEALPDGTPADAVEFSYMIQVGLEGAADTIADGDTSYFRAGRVPFEDNTFKLEDSLSFFEKGEQKDVEPLYVTMQPLFGENPASNAAGSQISTDVFNARGYSGSASNNMYPTSEDAPYKSEYEVKAYYPRDAFRLDFFDEYRGHEGVNDEDFYNNILMKAYQVKNDITLTYQLKDSLGASEVVVKSDAASGFYQEVNGKSSITIEKLIRVPVSEDGKMDSDNIPYAAGGSLDLDYYTGYAEFEIEKLDEAAGTFVHYDKAHTGDETDYTNVDSVVINPQGDGDDGDQAVSGENGHITVWVEPGTYRVTEKEGTLKKTAIVGEISTEDKGAVSREFTLREGDNESLSFVNKSLSGGIQFKKMAYAYDAEGHKISRNEEQAGPLPGVTFDLLQDGEVIKQAVSSGDGTVTFFPVDEGDYTIKESDIPDSAFLYDHKEYSVKVEPVSEDGDVKFSVPVNGEGNDVPVLYNEPNKAGVQITKWLYNDSQEDNAFVKISGSAAEQYAKAFTVEYNNGSGWMAVPETGTGLSLGTDGTVMLDLPIYYGGNKAEGTEFTQYRVIEAVPQGYTSKSYENQQVGGPGTDSICNQEYVNRDGVQTVATAGVKLEQEEVVNFNVINIPRGSIQLIKNTAEFEVVSESGRSSIRMRYDQAEQGREFCLLKQSGSEYELAASGITGAGGVIVFDDIDIWDAEGNAINYYWYEKPSAEKNEILEVYDKEYQGKGSAGDNKAGAIASITIKDNSGTYNIDGAVLAGPFNLSRESTTTAYAYNVQQKIPYWINKEDNFNQDIKWNDHDAGTQFKFEIQVKNVDGTYGTYKTYQADNRETEVFNDGTPVFLETGKEYRIKEIGHPDNYSDFAGKTEDGDIQDSGIWYKIIDLTGKDPISLGTAAPSDRDNTTTFVNQRRGLLEIIKYSLGDLDNKQVTDLPSSKQIQVKFDVYKVNEGEVPSESNRLTDVNLVSNTANPADGTNGVYLEPGIYYVKEQEIPASHIDPAFYLKPEEGKQTGEYTIGDNKYHYYKEGNNIYYGPIEVKVGQKGDITVPYEINNYRNEGSVKVFKYDISSPISGSTTEEGAEKQYKVLEKAKFVVEQWGGQAPAANGWKQVDKIRQTGPQGMVTFPGLPVYNESGEKIVYRIREVEAPANYDIDSSVYQFTIEPGICRTTGFKTTIDENASPEAGNAGNLTKMAFYDNPLGSITVQKLWYDSWEHQFPGYTAKHQLPGVELALYQHTPGDTEARLILKNDSGKDIKNPMTTSEADATVSFTNLDRTKNYFVVEAYKPDGYDLPDGKIPLAEKNGGLPAAIEVVQTGDAVELKDSYNYTIFEALPPETENKGARTSTIENQKSWVQFNIHKLADYEITKSTPSEAMKAGYTKEITDTATGENYLGKELEQKHSVNGARFELYSIPVTEDLGKDLDAIGQNMLNSGNLVDTYESGTMLDQNGNQMAGQFMTTVMSTGNIYWLREVHPGGGYTALSRIQNVVFVPDSPDSYTFTGDTEATQIIQYQPNAINYADAYNYKWRDGEGTGTGYTAYFKLNKWLETKEQDKTVYKPLGGVKFELRAGGITIADLETGLDNEWKGENDKITGQAMTEMLSYDRIISQLKMSVTGAEDGSDLSPEQQARWDEFAGAYLSEEGDARIIKCQLVETAAPDMVEPSADTYPVDLKFSSQGSLMNDEYFWNEEQSTKPKLVNRLMSGYRVEVTTWGYVPKDEMFKQPGGNPGANFEIDEDELERMSQEELNSVRLDGVKMTLFKYNYVSGKYEACSYNKNTGEVSFKGAAFTFTTGTNGSYVFSQGLPVGLYALREERIPQTVQEDRGLVARYFNRYPGAGSQIFKYFQVQPQNGGSSNVVNLFNPELPSLEVEKKLISGRAPELDKLTVTLNKGAQEAYSSSFNNSNVARFGHIDPGGYLIGEKENMPDGNAALGYPNPASVTIGFANGGKGKANYLYKLNRPDTIPLNHEDQPGASIVLTDPMKGELNLTKVDADDGQIIPEPAEFEYYYSAFNESELIKTDVEGRWQAQYTGPVTAESSDDMRLAAEGRQWGEAIGTVKSDGGRISLVNLEPGWYKLVEKKAPVGYETDTTPYYVSVTSDMNADFQYYPTDGGSISNRKLVDLNIVKLLDYGDLQEYAGGKPVPSSVTFGLYKAQTDNNGSIISQVMPVEYEGAVKTVTITDMAGGGKGVISGIPQINQSEYEAGWRYFIREEKVEASGSDRWLFEKAGNPAGGEENRELAVVSADNNTYIQLPGFNTKNDVSLAVTNKLAKAEITVTKIRDNNPDDKLAGAEFALYSARSESGLPEDQYKLGEAQGVVYIPDGNGNYTFSNVPAEKPEGTVYYIYETKAPESYYVKNQVPVEVTVYPGGRYQYNPADAATAYLLVNNETGANISLTKHMDVYGGGKADVTPEGIEFTLYTRDAGGDGVWRKAQANETAVQSTDGSGTIKWTGLSIINKEYALYESENTKGQYLNYKLDSVYNDGTLISSGYGEAVSPTEDGEKLLYVIPDLSAAGKDYQLDAYNKPPKEIKLIKQDLNPESGSVPEAGFKIKDNRTGSYVLFDGSDLVSTKRNSGSNYSEASIKLSDGEYTIEEWQTSDGYWLIRDDDRVKTEQVITVSDTMEQTEYTFVNMKPSVQPDLDKRVESVNRESITADNPVLSNLWWNDNQTVSYSITPKSGSGLEANNIPLSSYSVEDKGLEMLDENGDTLGEAGDINSQYTSNAYEFTELTIPVPVQDGESHIIMEGGPVVPGVIGSTVTVRYFDGSEEVFALNSENLEGGAWKVDIRKEGTKARAFTIQYEDSAIKEATAGRYVLNTGFKPGTIYVDAVVYQQDYKLDQGKYKAPVKTIRNWAQSVEGYQESGISRDTDLRPNHKDSEWKYADVSVMEPDIPTIAIDLSVDKPGLIQLDNKLTYMMSLTNVSDKEIKSRMVEPVVMNRLPKGVVPDKGTVAVTLDGAGYLNYDCTVTQGDDGYQYLVIEIQDDLEKNQKVEISFEAQVTNAVINNDLKNIEDFMYVTSKLFNKPFTGNEGGATFQWQEPESIKWPDLRPEANGVANSMNLWSDLNGYAHMNLHNEYQSEGSITLLKEGRGNEDSAYVAEPVSAQVTSDGSGEITYHLTAMNTSGTGQILTKFRILDMLPRSTRAVEDFEGNSRFSKWDFLLQDGTIRAYISRADGTEESVDIKNIWYLPESADKAGSVLSNYGDPTGKGWSRDSFGRDTWAIMVDIELSEQQSVENGDRIVVEYKASVEPLTDEGLMQKACTNSVNNFSMLYSYKNNKASEQEKTVGRHLTSNNVQATLIPGRVGVGGRIWIDANGNGIQDDEKYNTEADLKKLVSNGYFGVGINTDGTENAKIDKAPMGTVGSGIPAQSEMSGPKGAMDENGRFRFTGILPAQPNNKAPLYTGKADDENHNTIRNQLLSNGLNGSKPQTSYLTVTVDPDRGIDGMKLEKTLTTMKAENESNESGGMSRRPSELIGDRDIKSETHDSNFVKTGEGKFRSEEFFLWSDLTQWDETKDFGVIPYRGLEFMKKDAAGNPVEGARFAVYGPFDSPEEAADAFIAGDDGKLHLKEGTAAGKILAPTDAEGRAEAADLLYYMTYVVVEEDTPAQYMLDQAEAKVMAAGASEGLPIKAGDALTEASAQAEANWIIPQAVTGLEVINQYGTGGLELKKVDAADNRTAIEGAVFELRCQSTKVDGAWMAFLENLRDEENGGAGWPGVVTSTILQGESLDQTAALRFTMGNFDSTSPEGMAVLAELPYGVYTLKEVEAPAGYILGDTPWQSRAFEINREHSTAEFTRDIVQDESNRIAAEADNTAVSNERSRINVHKISAVNETTSLAGAVFILQYTGDGPNKDKYVTAQDKIFTGYADTEEEAARFITNEDGQFKVEKLLPGTYKLIEKQAPTGYEINTDIPEITLDGQHQTPLITIKDEAVVYSGGDNGFGGGGSGGSGGGHGSVGGNGGPGDSTYRITDGPVPLAMLPDAPQTTILDEDVPLAGLPKTGERLNRLRLASVMTMALSGILLILEKHKKREENNG